MDEILSCNTCVCCEYSPDTPCGFSQHPFLVFIPVLHSLSPVFSFLPLNMQGGISGILPGSLAIISCDTEFFSEALVASWPFQAFIDLISNSSLIVFLKMYNVHGFLSWFSAMMQNFPICVFLWSFQRGSDSQWRKRNRHLCSGCMFCFVGFNRNLVILHLECRIYWVGQKDHLSFSMLWKNPNKLFAPPKYKEKYHAN